MSDRRQRPQAYTLCTHLQTLLLRDMEDPGTKAAVRSSLARSFVELEQLKRAIAMKPLPKSVDVLKYHAARAAARQARQPTQAKFSVPVKESLLPQDRGGGEGGRGDRQTGRLNETPSVSDYGTQETTGEWVKAGKVIAPQSGETSGAKVIAGELKKSFSVQPTADPSLSAQPTEAGVSGIVKREWPNRRKPGAEHMAMMRARLAEKQAEGTAGIEMKKVSWKQSGVGVVEGEVVAGHVVPSAVVESGSVVPGGTVLRMTSEQAGKAQLEVVAMEEEEEGEEGVL